MLRLHHFRFRIPTALGLKLISLIPDKKVLLTNDLTPKVLQEAVNFNANVVISYHPPLFVSFKRISQDNWKDRLVTEALKHNIAIYSPHTAHDAWAKGVNSWLIQGLLEGEKHIPISPTIDEREMYEISGMGNFFKIGKVYFNICGVVLKKNKSQAKAHSYTQKIGSLSGKILTKHNFVMLLIRFLELSANETS